MNKCIGCDVDIPRGMSGWQEVRGWEQKRSEGGTNHVALRQPTGRMACDSCMALKRAGLNHRQEGMKI